MRTPTGSFRVALLGFITLIAGACASSAPPVSRLVATSDSIAPDSSAAAAPIRFYMAEERGPRCPYERLERIDVERRGQPGESPVLALRDVESRARRAGAQAVVDVRVTTKVPFATNGSAVREGPVHRVVATAVRFTDPACVEARRPDSAR